MAKRKFDEVEYGDDGISDDLLNEIGEFLERTLHCSACNRHFYSQNCLVQKTSARPLYDAVTVANNFSQTPNSHTVVTLENALPARSTWTLQNTNATFNPSLNKKIHPNGKRKPNSRRT